MAASETQAASCPVAINKAASPFANEDRAELAKDMLAAVEKVSMVYLVTYGQKPTAEEVPTLEAALECSGQLVASRAIWE